MTGVALVTGGSRGIGRAVCVEAARRGHDVVIGCRDTGPPVDAVVADVEALGVRAVAVAADLASRGSAGVLAAAARELGPVTLLVNNAGITMSGPLRDLTEAAWDAAVEVNLSAPALLSRELADDLVRARGAIVNIASTGGIIGSMHSLPYGSTKAGVLGLTKTLARMLAPHVRVNAVCPGPIATDLLSGVADEALDEIVRGTPLARLGSPDEIARVVLDVAAWTYCTGQSFVADGGRVMM